MLQRKQRHNYKDQMVNALQWNNLCLLWEYFEAHTYTVTGVQAGGIYSRNLCFKGVMNDLKADSHITCRAHAVPLPCRAAKGLECVFPILFTQCGLVWFTLAMPRPCHPRQCYSSQGHGTAWPSRKSLWTNCPRSASSALTRSSTKF